MVLSLLGSLIEPTDRYTTKSNRDFAIVLTAFIKILVSSITPASFLTFLYLAYNYENYQQLNSPIWETQVWFLVSITIWSLIEIVFYFHCQNVKRIFSNTSSTLELTWSKRLFYLERVLSHNPNIFKSLAKWFHKHDELNGNIQLEHIEEWLSWAFFNKLKTNLTPEELNELNMIVEKCLQADPSLVRNKCTRTKATGDYTPLEFMKLNLDPIEFQHKPFIGYLVSCCCCCFWFRWINMFFSISQVISLMQLYGTIFLYFIGFTHYNCPTNSTLSYWIYSGRSNGSHTGIRHVNKPPVFLVYGIGIGATMYLKVINAIKIKDPDRTIIVLDLPHISLKLVHEIPSFSQTLEVIDDIFKKHDLSSCNWFGHSYGSIIIGWVIKERPKYVNKVSFVDPVCFSLWEPDLIRNFLYNYNPIGPIHHLAQYFVAKDLLVASTLFRHFWWLQNILFPEDLICQTHVYFSECDWIINSKGMCEYLDNFRQQNSWVKLSTEMMDNVAHGGFISSDDKIAVVLKHV